MIKFENLKVEGFEPAIRGMRNPMNSWEKSDSWFEWYTEDDGYTTISNNILWDVERLRDYEMSEWQNDGQVYIGPEDHSLMLKLAKAGSEHSKYRRMIVVWVDITAPLYWWKEFDTYKIGTVANSCSTMHKIHAKEFEIEDFSHEHLMGDDARLFITPLGTMDDVISALNDCRKIYLETKDKRYWWQMIQLLPSSYNQKRTVMLNYENLAHIYKQRKDHKLDEWREFCKWIKILPYSELITLEVANDNAM